MVLYLYLCGVKVGILPYVCKEKCVFLRPMKTYAGFRQFLCRFLLTPMQVFVNSYAGFHREATRKGLRLREKETETSGKMS